MAISNYTLGSERRPPKQRRYRTNGARQSRQTFYLVQVSGVTPRSEAILYCTLCGTRRRVVESSPTITSGLLVYQLYREVSARLSAYAMNLAVSCNSVVSAG